MEPAGGTGGGGGDDAFEFPSRRQGSGKPSHRRAASSPAIDHDFLRSSMYSSGPFGVLGDPSNGLFSPRLAVGSKGHHREPASIDFTAMSSEDGGTSYSSGMGSLFERGLESIRSDFLKMDLGRRRISEDERERVSHHSSTTAAEPSDDVSPTSAGGAGPGPGAGPRSVNTLSRSLSSAAELRAAERRSVVSSPDTALHMLSSGASLSSSGRRPPSSGPSMDSSSGSPVGVSAVLGGPGGGGSGGGSAGGGGVGVPPGSGGADGSRVVNGTVPVSVPGRAPPASHQSSHHVSNGGVLRNGGGGSGGGGGSRGGDRERDRDRDRDRDRRLGHGPSHGGGGFRGHGGRNAGGGQGWSTSGSAIDDGYTTFGYRDPLHNGSGSGGGGNMPPPQNPAAAGIPMYAVHNDGYSQVPMQHTFALNGDAYSQGVVPPPHAHMQNHQSGGGGGGMETPTSSATGDQQLLAPHHLSSMGSPPLQPMSTPQAMFMPAQGTYMLAGGNGGGGNNGVSSSGGGGMNGGGGGGGSGGAGGHLQPGGGGGGGGGIQPLMVYQPQTGNGPPPPMQQQQQGASSGEHGAAAAATHMYVPMPQTAYGFIPHVAQMQGGGGLPLYQVAGPTLDGSQGTSRSNGVAGGSTGASGGGHGNGSGSPTIASQPSNGPSGQQLQHQQPPPQGLQVHYALTPQGIVPLVPMMPNSAGGFTNPASLYPGVGGMFDDGRGGVTAIPAVVPGINGIPLDGKGRVSPPLPGGPSMQQRYGGSPPPPQSHMQHTQVLPPQTHMHPPAWSITSGGVHDTGGGPMGYPDGSSNGGGYNDGGYRGGGSRGGGGSGGIPGREGRLGRDGDSGKDMKDRRKRLDRESDMAALLEATRPALKDVLGKVYSMSRDQVGCRLLQQKLDECPDRPPDGDVGGNPNEEDPVSAIFEEALPDLPQMMVDPFGNYLFQKLFIKIDDHQRLLAVEAVTERMPEAAVNLHGTRCVQKVVELCRTDAQAVVIARSLGPSVVKLSLDPNGNHVIQRALQHMPAPRNDFVLEAITESLVQVAVHRHGCCVLQRCLDAAGPELRIKLINEVARNGLKLMQDPFGNYVVQYVLKTCSREETYQLCSAPLGHVASLSTQKFSSNVMEACLERAMPEVQAKFVEELAQQGRIRELILDQYANYVVQRALTVAGNEEGLKLVAAIRPHLHSMQSTSSGRRIAAKIIKRYPTVDLGEEILMLMSRG